MPASPTPPEAVAAVLAVSDRAGEREGVSAAVTWQRVLTAASVDQALTAVDGAAGLAVVVAAHGASFDGAAVLCKVRAERPDCRRVLVVRDADEGGIDAIDACRPHRVLRAWPDAASLGSMVRGLVDWSRRARERRGGARDPLTGLYSAVGFEERLREELARARRYGKPLSILCGGIDALDEADGEGVALERIAGFLMTPDHPDRLRESDVAGRLASGDIAILLPETSKEGAAVKAERVRLAVAEAARAGGTPARASVGVAGFPDDADSPVGLLRSAEQALTAARGSAASCVRLAIGAGAADVGRQRVALDPDDFAVLRRERFATYHVRLFDVVSALRRDHSLSCLFVDLSELRRVEREVGPTHHADLLARAGELLEELRGDRLGAADLICRTEDHDGYLCFLASPRHAAGGAIDLESIASRVESILERELGAAATALARELPRIGVGFSRVLDNPLVRPERLLARLVADAQRSALLHRERSSLRHKAFLQEIILRGRLRAVYQPIVDLATGAVFGFEGLARGPSESPLESPSALFSVAEQVDLTFELDRACFRSALATAVGLHPGHRLFLNLLPTSFYDSSFIEHEVSNLLEAAALQPANVVFEITERLAIEDFASFRRALSCYTRAGFGVAIDDVGTRHSNLEAVMALRPNFLKLSDVLTRGLSNSTVKREMVRSLQRIAEAINAVIVAEGIERADDLAVLCDLGVGYGQGYLLARPGPPFPEVKQMVRRRTVRGSLAGEPSVTMPILAGPWAPQASHDGADAPEVRARPEAGTRSESWLPPPWLPAEEHVEAGAGRRAQQRAISSAESFGDEETISGRRR